MMMAGSTTPLGFVVIGPNADIVVVEVSNWLHHHLYGMVVTVLAM